MHIVYICSPQIVLLTFLQTSTLLIEQLLLFCFRAACLLYNNCSFLSRLLPHHWSIISGWRSYYLLQLKSHIVTLAALPWITSFPSERLTLARAAFTEASVHMAAPPDCAAHNPKEQHTLARATSTRGLKEQKHSPSLLPPCPGWFLLALLPLLFPSIPDAWPWNLMVLIGEVTIARRVPGTLAQALNGALHHQSSCVSWGSSHHGLAESWAWSGWSSVRWFLGMWWQVLLTSQQRTGYSPTASVYDWLLNRFSPNNTTATSYFLGTPTSGKSTSWYCPTLRMFRFTPKYTQFQPIFIKIRNIAVRHESTVSRDKQPNPGYYTVL